MELNTINYFVCFRYEELEAKLIAEKLSPLDKDPPKINGKPASDDTEEDKKAIVKIVDSQKGIFLRPIFRTHQTRGSGENYCLVSGEVALPQLNKFCGFIML